MLGWVGGCVCMRVCEGGGGFSLRDARCARSGPGRHSRSQWTHRLIDTLFLSGLNRLLVQQRMLSLSRGGVGGSIIWTWSVCLEVFFLGGRLFSHRLESHSHVQVGEWAAAAAHTHTDRWVFGFASPLTLLCWQTTRTCRARCTEIWHDIRTHELGFWWLC